MTKKDFELLARAFNAQISYAPDTLVDGVKLAAFSVADELKDYYPRFDETRFLEACGIPQN